MKLFRCSQLADLIVQPRNKSDAISQTAKAAIRAIAKDDLFGFKAFTGNKFTKKGNLLESTAIRLSGAKRFRHYEKHIGRVSNELITGECDILDRKNSLIIDTKCTWDIGTHPFFYDEAVEKVKKAGYDIQMQGYMWLYDLPRAEIDFWLLPCPPELLSDWDDHDQLIDFVENIPLEKRLTTIVIERDEAVIDQLKAIIPHCQYYYHSLIEQHNSLTK